MDFAAYPKLIGDNGYCWLVVTDIRIRNMRKTSGKLKYLLLLRKLAFPLTSLNHQELLKFAYWIRRSQKLKVEPFNKNMNS